MKSLFVALDPALPAHAVTRTRESRWSDGDSDSPGARAWGELPSPTTGVQSPVGCPR